MKTLKIIGLTLFAVSISTVSFSQTRAKKSEAVPVSKKHEMVVKERKATIVTQEKEEVIDESLAPVPVEKTKETTAPVGGETPTVKPMKIEKKEGGRFKEKLKNAELKKASVKEEEVKKKIEE